MQRSMAQVCNIYLESKQEQHQQQQELANISGKNWSIDNIDDIFCSCSPMFCTNFANRSNDVGGSRPISCSPG